VVAVAAFMACPTILVNPHAWGEPASANPALHLRKLARMTEVVCTSGQGVPAADQDRDSALADIAI
jgi:hypothetical protein